MKDSELLFQAAENYIHHPEVEDSLGIIKSLVEKGARNDKAFITYTGAHFYHHAYDEDEEGACSFNLYEALMLAGHPLPTQNNTDNIDTYLLIRLIGLAPDTYSDRVKTLISLMVDTNVFTNGKSLHTAITSLVRQGNIKGIEILIPPETSEEQLKERLSNVIHTCPLYADKMTRTDDHYFECVKYLLNIMPEWEWVNLFPIRNQVYSPGNLLNIALSHGKKDFFEWLLKSNRANPIENCRTNPFTTVFSHNQTHLVDTLFDLKCNPGLCAEGTTDPITQAISRKQYHFIPKLIASGANVNHQNIVDQAPLISAVSMTPCPENTETIALLLKSGANTEITDSDGKTALIIACSNDYLDVFLLLRQAGANFNHLTPKGETATMIINQQHGAIKAFLEEEQLNQHTKPANSKKKTLRI